MKNICCVLLPATTSLKIPLQSRYAVYYCQLYCEEDIIRYAVCYCQSHYEKDILCVTSGLIVKKI